MTTLLQELTTILELIASILEKRNEKDNDDTVALLLDEVRSKIERLKKPY